MAILANDAIAAFCLVLLTVSACSIGSVAPPPAPLGPVIVLPPAKTAGTIRKARTCCHRPVSRVVFIAAKP